MTPFHPMAFESFQEKEKLKMNKREEIQFHHIEFTHNMYKSHMSYQLMEERERNGNDCDCEEEQKTEKEMVEK